MEIYYIDKNMWVMDTYFKSLIPKYRIDSWRAIPCVSGCVNLTLEIL